MKKYDYNKKAVLMEADVHRLIQLCARYFSCTQSEFIMLLLRVARLTDSDNLKGSSVRMMDEHLDYYFENNQRKPGLQEILNIIAENK